MATQGILEVEAVIKAQKVTLKTAYNQSALILGAKNYFVLDGHTFQLAGTWSSKQPAFQGQLNKATLKAFLANMVADLNAKSGLIVKPLISSSTLTGSEQSMGRLQGEWRINSKITFLKYPGQSGQLSVRYRFTGKRLAI